MAARSRLLEYGLTALVNETDRLFLCSSDPTAYSDIAAVQLGVKSGTRGAMFGSITDHSPTGRQTSFSQITGGDCTGSGSISHVVIADSVNQNILFTKQLAVSKTVSSGWKFSFASFDIVIGAVLGFQIEVSSKNFSITTTPPATSGYDDGYAGAPAGSPNFPNLLDAYSYRPPWNVAGVDYHVGIPEGTSLKDPVIDGLPAGCAISGGNINVTGANIVLDGYDFSGYTLVVTGGNFTVQNSYFTGYGVYGPVNTTPGMTILNCTFYGDGQDFSGFITLRNLMGNKIVKYCYMYETPQHFLELDNGGYVDYRFNLLMNGGMLAGSHLNFSQFENNQTYPNALVSFNTMYQVPQAAGGEGLQCDPESAIVTNLHADYNTIMAILVGGELAMSYLVHIDNYATGSCSHNYYDARGSYGFAYPTGGQLSWVGNIDMNDGSVY